jgi:phosphate transport system substrate-binding protein
MSRSKIAMVSGKILVVFACVLMIIAGACNSDPNAPKQETTTSGVINISVDEAFKPVIDSQIKVFEALHSSAKINVSYKPEAECLKDLNNDSVRMVIVTRGLSADEEKILTTKLRYKPAYGPLAFDAIAVIVNIASKDTLFTMDDIAAMARGASRYKYKLLLDGSSATSNVRYVVDSILRGDPLTKNVVSGGSSQGVIDYISKSTDAVGLVGVSWVGNREDTTQLSFLKKIRIAEIECRGCKDKYVQPVQGNIALGRYPMVRPLYYILKENYEGVGSGFTNFLIYEKGQLIFSRAYLLPARMQFDIREMQISE